MGRMIGIDLGTTNCCAAAIRDGEVVVIPTRQGQRTMPSVVAFGDQGEELVGAVAQRQAITNPHRTIHAVKRLIGRKHSDKAIASWTMDLAYEVVAASNGDAWVRTRDRDYSPSEVSAVLLQEIKHAAEDFLGEEVTDAVVTVPAYFNDGQRQATKDAGAIAGLRVRNILNEPTAAALGYGVDKNKDQTLAIFDLGGGTFDITIMRTADGVFEVLATSGDTFLGGDDFDRALMEHLMRDFEAETGNDLHDDPVALQRLREASEQAKRELSSASTTSINLPFICAGPAGPLHLRHEVIERSLLERLTAGLIERLMPPCQQALKDAGIEASQLDQVLLVGGMTRMPAVQRKVEAIFGKVSAKDVNPDEIVAIGAATQCGILSGQLGEVALLDVTPYSLGVMTMGGKMSVVVPKNCAIPTRVTRTYSTTANYQNAVMIEVFQGESEEVLDNSYLGSFELGKLPLLPAGQVQVDVTFEMNADGVLEVSAKENSAGREASVTISAAGGLAEADLEKLTARHKAVAARS